MINLILFGSFFVMLLLNIPIAVSLGMSSIFALLFSSSPLTVVPTNVYSGMAKFLLLAIPFFVLSGNIMAKAGISSRLVAFADDCVGHRRGGIAIVAVIVACFFGAISGSGPATVAALGIILIPAMINRGGFSAPFASSLMASASSIAIVIPPSIAFVVYASITGVSVGDMFMGGWIPGIMMGLSLVIIIMIECRKKGIQASKAKSSWGQRWKSFREAFWGFLMPVIIIGGIYGGVFTPTEAAAVSVVYGLVVGVFIYREVKMKDMIDILVDSGKTTGNQTDGIQALMDGTTELSMHSNLIWSSFDQRFNVVSLPFLFSSTEEADAALDGAGGEALGEILESTYNVHLLGIAENGFRHITNSKHAIASKADMNGLKMRVAGSQLLNRSYELWGADYTNANWSEVFTALQTGTYDGQENPLPTADAASIQEVQSYLTYWTGAYDCLFFCMNAELYNSLSPELQAIVDEAGQAACEYERELNRSQDQEIMDKWAEAGVEITELTPEAAAEFAEASAPVYDEFADELTPELIEAFTSVTQADAGTTEPAA